MNRNNKQHADNEHHHDYKDEYIRAHESYDQQYQGKIGSEMEQDIKGYPLVDSLFPDSMIDQ